MTAKRDHLPEALAQALDALADEAAGELLAEARARATARVRAVLEDALVERILSRCAAGGRPDEIAGGNEGPAGIAPDPVKEEVLSDPAGEEVLYLYGILGADGAASALSSATSERPTELIVERQLAAVISRVPAAEFGDEHLKRNLERMDWLEQTARAHEAVLEDVRAHATVIPMRMCTLFRSVESVREMLAEAAEPLGRALDRLRGHDEWGIKALANATDVQRALAIGTTAADSATQPATGRAYLESKQADRRAASEVSAWMHDAASEIHEALAVAATAGLRNPIQPRELSGYEDEMVLNAAFLVSDSELGRFSALVEQLNDRYAHAGLRLELTGPWPPYNFVPPLGTE